MFEEQNGKIRMNILFSLAVV